MVRQARKANSKRSGWKTKLVLLLAALFTPLLLLEIVLRVYLGLTVGPDVMFFGFVAAKDTVQNHDNSQAGYTKYFPYQTRRDTDGHTGEVFDVTINSMGFRGDEFELDKADDVVRVVTLGASSTFGYRNRDDETYPEYLERFVDERCAIASVEVVNLAIPNLTTGEILALFRAEGVPLQPDVVTFYEGINDTVWQLPDPDAEAGNRFVQSFRTPYRFFKRRVLLVNFGDHIIKRVPWIERAVTRVVHAGGFESLESPESIDEQGMKLRGRFLDNLAKIHDEASRIGAQFVLMSQMSKSDLIPREKMRGVTYAEEARMIRDEWNTRGRVTNLQGTFLRHVGIMGGLEDWAHSRNIPYVDVIGALDERRDVLVSWVHLTPEGNRIIAETLGRQILPYLCPTSAAADWVDLRRAEPSSAAQ